MKHFVAGLVSFALPLSVLAQPTPAPAPAAPAAKSAPAPGTKVPAGAKAAAGSKTAPGAKAPAAASTKAPAKGVADKAAKAEEAPPKIEGMEIARGAKGFLGLQVTGGNFKLSFYDGKKKPMAPDVVRATLRWSPKYQPGPEFYVLGPGDGKSLTVAKNVRPPYQFKLFVSMFVEGVEEPTESFVVDFTQ